MTIMGSSWFGKENNWINARALEIFPGLCTQVRIRRSEFGFKLKMFLFWYPMYLRFGSYRLLITTGTIPEFNNAYNIKKEYVACDIYCKKTLKN